MKITLFDTETTGLPPEKQEIIQLYAINQDSEVIIDKRYKPSKEIEIGARAVHHIRNSHLEKEPSWGMEDTEAIDKLSSSSVMVAHNIEFDEQMCVWQGCKPFSYKICTKRVSKFLFPDLDSHRLEWLFEYFNLSIPEDLNFHDARFDVLMLEKIYQICFAKTHEYLLENKEESSSDRGVLSFMQRVTKTAFLLKRVPFGKHKGELTNKVPTDYYRWCLKNISDLDIDFKFTCEYYLK